MSDSDTTIYFDFASVNAKMHQYATTRHTSPTVRENEAISILDSLRALDKRIDDSDLFSTNELLEDVNTSSLKYLLVPYWHAQFVLEMAASFETRSKQLKEAMIALVKYIDRLDLLMMLNQHTKALFDGTKQLDPVALRKFKITLLQRERELMPKYLQLQQKWNQYALKQWKNDNRHNNDNNTIMSTSNEIGAPVAHYITTTSHEIDQEIDDNERDILVSVLEHYAEKSIQLSSSVRTELDIIAHHMKEQQDKRDQAAYHDPASKATPGSVRPGEMTSSANNGPEGTTQEWTQATQDNRHNNNNNGPVYTPHNVSVSTSGVSTGGLRVHALGSSDDVKQAVPEHMKQFMVKKGPSGQGGQQQQQHQHHHHHHGGAGGGAGHQHGPGCAHGHGHAHQPPVGGQRITKNDIMSDEERLSKPWFAPSAHTDCEVCKFEDVTQLPDYVMSNRLKGGRGKLVKMCAVHKVGVDVCGCSEAKDLVHRDRISTLVDMKTDRTRVFRDRNPYLMELDTWAQMKIDQGELPGIKDKLLNDRIKADQERHELRVENGESDDDESLKTQSQLDREEDEAQMEARAWADWTDDNQKGAGNKKYRK